MPRRDSSILMLANVVRAIVLRYIMYNYRLIYINLIVHNDVVI